MCVDGWCVGEMTRGFGQVVGGGGGRRRGDQFSPFQSAERGGRSLSFHVGHANRERQKGSSMPRIRTAVSGWTRKPRTTDSSVERAASDPWCLRCTILARLAPRNGDLNEILTLRCGRTPTEGGLADKVFTDRADGTSWRTWTG